jgi:hypothetical protein
MARFVSHEYDALAIGRPCSAQVMDSVVGQRPRFTGSGGQQH